MAKANDRSEFADILAEVVANMTVPVTVLNVTLMGASRSDAHIGTWSHPSSILDCSHWCLPGVPDAWNELVFSYLLTNGESPLLSPLCSTLAATKLALILPNSSPDKETKQLIILEHTNVSSES